MEDLKAWRNDSEMSVADARAVFGAALYQFVAGLQRKSQVWKYSDWIWG
jgi:hypothetical protein